MWDISLEEEQVTLLRVPREKLQGTIDNLGPILRKIDGLGIDIKLNFYIVKNTYDGVDEHGLLQTLYDHIPAYVLCEKDYAGVHGSEITRVYRESIGKFVKHENSGEFGELLLFCALEGQEEAVQLVSKMRLKTSPQMHFHGADCLHFKKEGDKNILYIGESKVQENFTDAANNAFESLKSLEENAKKKQFEGVF